MYNWSPKASAISTRSPFLQASKYSSFSSTLVRDVVRNNGDSGLFLPMEIRDSIAQLK